MIADAVIWTVTALLKICIGALVLWGAAYLVRVRKRQWLRACLCAALLFGVSLVVYNTTTLIPLCGAVLGVLATAALWHPIIAGAFDTSGLKAALILAIALLFYPGWGFGAL